MSPERREITVREKNGSVKRITVLTPNHDAPKLDLREPVWTPPHLRKPSWKKR